MARRKRRNLRLQAAIGFGARRLDRFQRALVTRQRFGDGREQRLHTGFAQRLVLGEARFGAFEELCLCAVERLGGEPCEGLVEPREFGGMRAVALGALGFVAGEAFGEATALGLGGVERGEARLQHRDFDRVTPARFALACGFVAVRGRFGARLVALAPRGGKRSRP